MTVLRTIESYENRVMAETQWNDYVHVICEPYPRFNLECGHSVPAEEVEGNVIECQACTEIRNRQELIEVSRLAVAQMRVMC